MSVNGTGERCAKTTAPTATPGTIHSRPVAIARLPLEEQKFQDDPHWREYILFYEYFHGDTGAGLGAPAIIWVEWADRPDL